MPADRIWIAQRAIVLQLLRQDRDERWTFGELVERMPDFNPQIALDGLIRLEGEGAIVALDGHFLASRCTRHLDSLGLIGI
jgi:hypothetical protein